MACKPAVAMRVSNGPGSGMALMLNCESKIAPPAAIRHSAITIPIAHFLMRPFFRFAFARC
jgi:hypothetical protein